ncbi:MAG: phage holin [Bacillus sp. (in: firmicutes)]
MNKDIVTLLGGFLTSLLLFLGTVGISYEWFTQESIDAFVIAAGALVALGINFYAVWKNTYVSKRAKAQERMLKRTNLK